MHMRQQTRTNMFFHFSILFPSDFYLRPFPGFKPDRCKQIPGHLVAQNTQPDTDYPEAERISEQIRYHRSDDCNAESRYRSRIQRISCPAQAAHVNNLTYLEYYGQNDHIHDIYADIHDMRFFKEEAEQKSG